VAELNKVYEAFLRLAGADRSALSGVELVREQTLVDKQGKPLAGEFKTTQGVSGTTVTDTRQLLIADAAFAHDLTSFIGSATSAGPISFETIVHEAGHAVEAKALLDARAAEFAAIAKQNDATAKFNQTVADTNAAIGVVNAENAKVNSAFNGYSRDPATRKPIPKDNTRKDATQYFQAIGAATRSINTFANQTSANAHPPSEKAAADAIAKRNQQRAALPAGNPAARDFAGLSKAQDDWFAAAVKRAAAQSVLESAKSATAAAKGVTAGASASIGKAKVSARLKAFVDFVTAKHIPPLTAYARDNWPAHPEEFFAEAYSLWLSDPDYLASQAPALKDWFDQGKHRL
jgi:hypothetical protein